MMDNKSDWIFYLKLSPKLPASFFDMDKRLKENGYTLIPVSFTDLVLLNTKEGEFHVLAMASSTEQATYFQRKVRKILHYLLRSKRMHMYFVSSFKFLDDTHLFGSSGHYHYVQLPVSVNKFCDTISETIKNKRSQSRKWPGASRRLGSTVG